MDLNSFPIKLKEIEPLIDRVVERYPFLSKVETIIVLKTLFETMREQFLKGEKLSLNTFFAKAHLIRFDKIRLGKWVKVVKIKSNTPRFIRYGRFRAL